MACGVVHAKSLGDHKWTSVADAHLNTPQHKSKAKGQKKEKQSVGTCCCLCVVFGTCTFFGTFLLFFALHFFGSSFASPR